VDDRCHVGEGVFCPAVAMAVVGSGVDQFSGVEVREMRYSLGLGVMLLVMSMCVDLRSGEPLVRGSAARPNVLLICVDDLKPLLGCYGDGLAKTPNLDRLAAAGVRFDRAFCNQAVCSPSRNALLTSLRPQTLGVYDLGTNFRLGAPQAVTLGQHFRAHGYYAESLGKIFHVGHGNGDDVRSWDVPAWKPKVGQYAVAANAAGSAGGEDAKGVAYEAADVPDNRYADGVIADEAIVRLRAAKERGVPFFLAVGFLKPHLPFVAPQKYWDLHAREKFAVAGLQVPPRNAPAWAPQFGGELRNYRDIPKQGVLSEDLQRTLIHGYYAAASYMDAQAGRVLDELQRLGLRDDTIVVLWGDHGWHLGDHGMWCKHTNYEQAARIPLIVSVSGGMSAAVSSALVETVDVYPTLAELAGLPQPAGVDGRSFAKVLADPAAEHRDHVIHVYPRSAEGRGSLLGRAIRTERYRMVEWKATGGSAADAVYELYDYVEDPQESVNLAMERPDVLRELQRLLAGHPEAKAQVKAGAAEKAGQKGLPGGKQDRGVMFERRDRNGDGRLSREEFLEGQSDPDKAPGRFLKFDANGDGILSREEFVTSGR